MASARSASVSSSGFTCRRPIGYLRSSLMARVSGEKSDSFQPMLGHCAIQRLRAQRQIQVPSGDGQIAARPPFETWREVGDEAAVEGVDLDLLGPVNALARRLAQDLRRIAVGVDHDARGALAGLVEPVRVG